MKRCRLHNTSVNGLITFKKKKVFKLKKKHNLKYDLNRTLSPWILKDLDKNVGNKNQISM